MNPEAQPYVGKKKVHVNPTVPPPPPPATGAPPQSAPPPSYAPAYAAPAPPPPLTQSNSSNNITKLRAVAMPFQPKGGSAPPPPPPPEYAAAASPLSQSQKSTDSDGFKSLNVAAAPYTPKKRSPTARGTPTFPDAPAPPMPVASGLQPVLQYAESPVISTTGSPTTSSVASPMSALAPPPQPAGERNPFAKSTLVVPEVVKEAPKDNKMEFHSAWTLWADDHPLTLGEQKFMEPVLVRDVSDLASFWALWWHCPSPSSCTPSWTYNWFRRLIKPVWEDPRNKNGGTFSFTIYDSDKPAPGQSRESIDDVFMLVIMGLSGESIPEAGAVNGVTLKIRPHRPVVLQLWTNTSDKARIGQFVAGLRAVVQRVLPSKCMDKLEYFSHTRMHQHSQSAAAAPNRFAKASAKASKMLEPDFTFRDTD